MVVELSVVIPCLNEAKTIGFCVQEAHQACKAIGVFYEIIVVDNNSKDNSGNIAKKAGAKVILETREGYGVAYKAGFAKASGKYVFMADGDGTYDFLELKQFYTQAEKNNYELVIGNRFTNHLSKKAMPALHRYVGNPMLSAMLRFLFGSGVKDAHCGMRLITKQAYERMHLTSGGMEFASEMIIKAAKQKIKTKQLNISYHPRQTPSKLHSIKDGWRHIRFMLVFSPTKVFFFPGILLSLIGLSVMLALINGPRQIGSVMFSTHPLLFGSMLFITGTQLLLSGYFLRVLAVNYFQEDDKLIKQLQKKVTFEKGVIVGAGGFLLGLVSGIIILGQWISTNYGKLDLPLSIIAFTFCIAGIQLILNSFYYISIQALTEGEKQ